MEENTLPDLQSRKNDKNLLTATVKRVTLMAGMSVSVGGNYYVVGKLQ